MCQLLKLAEVTALFLFFFLVIKNLKSHKLMNNILVSLFTVELFCLKKHSAEPSR